MSEVNQTAVQPVEPKKSGFDWSSLTIRSLAELAGTFMICLVAYAAGSYGTVLYGASPILILLATALAYAGAGAAFAKVSGSHFNPAVTLAAVLTSRIGWIDAIAYVIAQVLGGIAAGALIVKVLPTSQNVTHKLWLASAVNGYGDNSPSASMLSQTGISFGVAFAIALEVSMGLLVIAATIATLRKDGTATDQHALATGLAYGVAAAVTFPVTGAGLNPARSTGIALFAQGKGLSVEPLTQLPIFWVCPLLAGALVALVMLVADLMTKSAATKTADKQAVIIDQQPFAANDAEAQGFAQTPQTVEVDADADTTAEQSTEATEADKANTGIVDEESVEQTESSAFDDTNEQTEDAEKR